MNTLETLKLALTAGEKFCRRVNNGEVRSKESYNDFCTLNTHLREAVEREERAAITQPMLRAATEYSAKCAANGEIPSGKGYYEAMSAAKETTC